MTTMPAADEYDFGLAEHLAAIGRMHAEALAHLESLVKPWRDLSPRFGEAPMLAGQPTSDLPLVRALRSVA